MLRRYAPSESKYYPKCAFYEWTGMHCPGCGSTRALSALARGRFVDAVRNNPLLVLGGPIIFGLILMQRRREQSGAAAAPKLAWALFAVVVTYFVARNVPSPQRSWLAPPEVTEQQDAHRSESQDGAE